MHLPYAADADMIFRVFDTFLDLAVVVLPTVLSLVALWVSMKLPSESSRPRWKRGLVVFGVGISALTLVQQQRSKTAQAATELQLNTKYDTLSGNTKYIQGQLDALIFMAKSSSGSGTSSASNNSDALVTALKALSARLPALLVPPVPSKAEISTAANQTQARSLDHVAVTGMASSDGRLVASIAGQVVDASSKPPGTAYVVVLVSQQTRDDGSPDLATIQSVIDALRKLQDVKVFFADDGYSIAKGGKPTSFGSRDGGLSATGLSGAVFYYRKEVEAIAGRVRSTVDPVVKVKYLQLRPIPTAEWFYRDFAKASGVDIEVIL